MVYLCCTKSGKERYRHMTSAEPDLRRGKSSPMHGPYVLANFKVRDTDVLEPDCLAFLELD